MGSNFRTRDRCCLLDDDEDDEPVPQTFCAKMKYYFKRFKRCLPEYVPYILIGIVAVLVAFLFQAHRQKECIKEIYSNITQLKDSVEARLEDIEKALTRLAVSCGSSLPDGDEVKDEEKQESAEDIVKRFIRKYDADKTGMVDWAMEPLGGSVVSTRGTQPYILGGTTILGIPCTMFGSDPTLIIRPSTLPGECWAFKGEGTVIVKLATSIYVTNITLEHIAKEMAPDGGIGSAPKIFVVWGLPGDSPEGLKHNFGHYEYKDSGEPLQTFPVQNPSYSSYDLVEFNFKTNHGNKDFTCVYRIRVHGQLNMDKTIC